MRQRKKGDKALAFSAFFAYNIGNETKRGRAMNDRTLKRLVAVVAVLFALLVVTAVAMAVLSDDSEEATRESTSSLHDEDSVEEGVSYLESVEARDPETVLTTTESNPETDKETEPTETSDPNGLSEEQIALIEQVRSGEIDIWSMFHDYVILGDSRAVGFWSFDFLDYDYCLAGGGDTIRNIAEHMDEIIALNPKYIFLCYGLNDVSIGYWSEPEDYAAEIMEIIADLQEKLPEATVVVSSILPAIDPAFELSSKWRRIPEFSAAVGKACEEAGVIFVDNDAISAEHSDWWQPDGIHVRQEFYPYWAQNLIVALIEGGVYELNDDL